MSTSLEDQIQAEQYPWILHWTQLPVCKESMDFIAEMVMRSFKKLIEEGGDNK